MSQIVLLLGLILAALGGFGSYHFGKKEDREKARASEKREAILNDQVLNLNSQVVNLNKQLDAVQSSTAETHRMLSLIFKSGGLAQEEWTEVQLKNVPEGVADYIILLFISDKGRVSGKVRIKDSNVEYPFTTTANNRIPLAIKNLWLPEKGHYKIPAVLEFLITEKTETDATLSIYTQGWIDSRGTEPH